MAGKSHIVDHVAQQVDGLTKKQAGEAFDAVLTAIQERLRQGERVMLPGLGTLSVTERAARKGRNPATGKIITIPSRRAARFKPASTLKVQLSRPRVGGGSRSTIDGGSTTDPPRSRQR